MLSVSGEQMRLPELIEGLPIAGSIAATTADVEVRGVSHDSRSVRAGDLFVAWQGDRFDGAAFVRDALDRGAVAVLTEDPQTVDIPSLVTEQPRALLGPLAARVYAHPDRELRLVGVTGTNGKTTVSTLVAAILEAEGSPAALFGTLGYHFRDEQVLGLRTTPEASDLFRLLRRWRDAGAAAAVMEVSSHGLIQGRVDGARFDVGLFLNLTRDHLDFHEDLEEYFEAKARLFRLLKVGGRGVVNSDDPWGRRLASRLTTALTFGADGAVRYRDLDVSASGIRGTALTPRFEVEVESPLLGPYNAYNILAAVAAGEALGVSRRAMEVALAEQQPIEGRMDRVDKGQPFPVVIDFAHTDAALRAALEAMRSLGDYKILVVFGCGGGKDRGKRELMGRVAAELSDFAILTSDNPRDEDPMAILEQVEAGFRSGPSRGFEVVEDRRAAIERAIRRAHRGWAVLIAGKGHEQHQTVGSQRHPFVDREEAERALEERFGSASNR